MPQDSSSHNIYSKNKSKIVFQNPNEKLEDFDYGNKYEEKQSSSGENFGNNLGVKILEKLFGFLTKKNNQNTDY